MGSPITPNPMNPTGPRARSPVMMALSLDLVYAILACQRKGSQRVPRCAGIGQGAPVVTAASIRPMTSAGSRPFDSAARQSRSSERFLTPRTTVSTPGMESA
jgi:hypothetical protein